MVECNHEIKYNTSLIHVRVEGTGFFLESPFSWMCTDEFIRNFFKKIEELRLFQHSNRRFFTRETERNHKEHKNPVRNTLLEWKKNARTSKNCKNRRKEITLENANCTQTSMREIEGGCRRRVSQVSLKYVSSYLYCIDFEWRAGWPNVGIIDDLAKRDCNAHWLSEYGEGRDCERWQCVSEMGELIDWMLANACV